jgi:hypothetical protein
MGPLPRRPWSAFQARKVLKQHSLTIPRDHQGVAIVVEFSIIGKDVALASFHCSVISLEDHYNNYYLTLEWYVVWLDISTTPSRSWGARLLSRWNRSRSLQPRPDELQAFGHDLELRTLSPRLLVVPLIKL